MQRLQGIGPCGRHDVPANNRGMTSRDGAGQRRAAGVPGRIPARGAKGRVNTPKQQPTRCRATHSPFGAKEGPFRCAEQVSARASYDHMASPPKSGSNSDGFIKSDSPTGIDQRVRRCYLSLFIV